MDLKNPIPKLLVACLLGLVTTPNSAQASAVDLRLEDEIGPVRSLEVGRSLSARVTGLAPGQRVRVTVLDSNSWPVVSVDARADSLGEAEIAPLWPATGIVGCDCDAEVGAYAFPRPETAIETLAGRTFRVQVESSVGSVLAATGLPVVTPNSPIAFPADATGCPRFLLQDFESLYLLVLGGRAGAQTDVTVAPGNGPIVEVRSSQPEGPTFPLSGSGFEVILLWPGPHTSPGGYRVVVGGGGWPPMNSGGSPINTGVIVEDHSCPPSDDPPTEG